MDLDFDKEIDTLLRKAHHDDPVVGDLKESRHLDADEISAFAENAMPDNSRALYTAHLADCPRCRKILSNVLVVNAEAAPMTAPSPGVIAIAAGELPWHRRLFVFPNLAYVMGSLVLIFGGFLASTVIQNSRSGDAEIISQASDSGSTQGGPYFEGEPEYAANSNSTANVAANTAASAVGTSTVSTNSMITAAPSQSSANATAAGERPAENNFAADGTTSSADVKVTSAPPPAAEARPVAKDARERDDSFKAKAEDKVAGAPMQEGSKNDSMLKQQSPGSLSQSQSGPMRNNENAYNRQLENLDRRAAAKKRLGTRDEETGSGRRVVSGKTFDRKQGVWYDSAYQGRPTINVRRATDEFNRLDGGLRSIANSLGGTVVVVWGAKAYRIQ